MPENCWKIECWIEVFLPAQNPMKEYDCLQSKFAKPFDVFWNNFMPTSHFPFYACFWILIATTGTFQLICIMNFVIIQRPLLRNKHVICPQNEFYDLLCNRTPLVSSERVVSRQLLSPFFGRDLYLVICTEFHEASLISLLKLNVLFVVFAVFLPVLVCILTLQQPWYSMCLCMCL